MKTVIVISMALGLSACAHPKTEMDRELALKLVDKAGRIEIVQTGNPILSVNSNAQRTPNAVVADYPEDGEQENCMNSPVYSVSGKFLRFVRHCFGAN